MPKRACPKGQALFGASDLTRTGDLLITSEMHYRLCYTSIDLPSHYIGFAVKSQQFFGNHRNPIVATENQREMISMVCKFVLVMWYQELMQL